MKVEIIVDENVTSCAQLRIKRKSGSYHLFVCGIDMIDERTFVSNYPPVHGGSFLEWAQNVLQWKLHVDHQNMRDIEYVYICDDSEVLVLPPSCYDEEDYNEQMEMYHAELEEKQAACKEKLARSKYAFWGLTQDEYGRWHGELEV